MKMTEGKRLIRPVERQPMREWLIDHLENDDVPGCSWTDRNKGEFHIKWCHGSRHGWSMKDADLFERWAKHTGRFSEKTKDPKKWKANFRCALNSRKDIDEITKKGQLKGASAYRVYRMKGPIVRDRKPRMPALPDLELSRPTIKVEKNKSPSECSQYPETDLFIRLQSSIAESKFQSQLPNFDKILPQFEKLEYGKMHILPKQGSGFCVQVVQQAELLEQLPGISRSHLRTLPIRHETEINMVPSPNTYPLTPEDSEASQADDEDMEFLMSQDVSEEVTIESSEDVEHDRAYIITDISTNTSVDNVPYKYNASYSASQLLYTQVDPVIPSSSGFLQQPFCPLTPP